MADLTAAPKGFISRPEGKVGLAISAGIIGLIVWFLGSSIADYLVHATDNLLHMAVVGGSLLLIFMILSDARFRSLFYYLYRSVMRFITGMFINIDPIGVLKTYKERMEGKLEELNRSLGDLKGQRLKVSRLMDSNKRDLDNEYHLVQQAKQQGNERAAGLEGKQIVRLESMKERYTGDVNRMTLLITILDRYQGLCSDTVTDMSREIDYRVKEREYSKSSRNVVRSATAILKGLPEKDMWDESLDNLENQYTAAIGEVENFLDVTKNIISSADLQDAADSQKAGELLDKYLSSNSTMALGGSGSTVTKADVILQARKSIAGSNPAPVVARRATASGDDDYLDMLKQ